MGPEYISTRPGAGGGKVHYLAAEKVINLANEVLGFNGWSSSVQNVQIDFVDENTTNGKITLGLSTIVRVTLRDGTYHEDIGYGHIENCKGKAAAFEKAKKEAVTDAMKRALRNFGNVLGNCLYDKDYLSKVTKVKVAPSKWDAENLYRHADFAPVKRESIANAAVREQQAKSNGVNGNVSGNANMNGGGNEGGRTPSNRSAVSIGSGEFDDDFGGNDLDDTDFSHPDEVRLDDSRAMESPAQSKAQNNEQRNGVQRMQSMPNIRAPNLQPPQPPQGLQAPQRPQAVQRPPMNTNQGQPGRMLPPQTPGKQLPSAVANGMPGFDGAGTRSHSSSAEEGHEKNGGLNGQHDDYQPPMPTEPPAGVLAGFVTGRSASLLNQVSEGKAAANAPAAFNPHAESPSIRRTQGVNPGKSAPIMRESLGTALANASTVPPQYVPPQQGNNGASGPGPNRANFTNPSIDPTRRIGMPGGGPNRGAYKPPSAVKRPALTDVSNLPQTDGGADAKRQRVESPAPGMESGPG